MCDYLCLYVSIYNFPSNENKSLRIQINAMHTYAAKFHKQDIIPTEPFFTFSIKLPSIVT